MESSKTDFYGKFKIVAICKASAYAVAEKYTEYDDWHITIQFGSFSFSIANSEESDGVDKNGNRLTYKLTGDSRNNIPLLGERNESASETCELTCKCEYPNGETMSLVVTLTAEISTFFNESSQNHKIGFRLGEPSISVRKK